MNEYSFPAEDGDKLENASFPVHINQRIDPDRLQPWFNRIRSSRLPAGIQLHPRGAAFRRLAADIEARNRALNFFSGHQWRSQMERNEWTVPYVGTQLADAAAEKRVYHDQRRMWWADKREEVMAKIKSEGIAITDSIVDELSKTGYSNTGGFGPTVQIDAAMQNHLAEAHSKMKQHEKLVKEYGAWEQMMRANAAASFNLQIDDWMYFFGR